MPNLIDRIVGDPDNVPYAANTNKQQRFDKVSVLNFLRLRVTGTLTLASYSGNPTKYVESIENVIGQIILTAVGSGAGSVSDVLKATDFAWLYRHTQIITGTAPTRTDVSNTNGTYNFETNAVLFLGGLDARVLSSLIMTVSWRDQTAIVTGGTGGTATLSNLIVVTHAREVLGLPVRPTRAFIKESQIPYDITATRQDQKLSDLPVGNVIQRMCFKGLLGAVDYADPSDTPFANTTRTEGPHVRLKANSAFTVADYVYGALKSENKERFKIESWPAGYVIWQPRVPFNAKAASRLDGFVDTYYTGGQTNRIQVTTVEVVKKG